MVEDTAIARIALFRRGRFPMPICLIRRQNCIARLQYFDLQQCVTNTVAELLKKAFNHICHGKH